MKKPDKINFIFLFYSEINLIKKKKKEEENNRKT